MRSLPSRRGHSTLAVLILLALPALLPAAAVAEGAPAVARPCRIAVTGALPTGYLGLLARCGMPHDVLLEYQLADPAVVSRYDLVIVAGLDGGVYAGPAFQRLLGNGGSVLFDCSLKDTPPPEWLLPDGVKADDASQEGAWKRDQAALRLVGDRNPLRSGPGADDAFPTARANFAPAPGTANAAQVLAEYSNPFATVREGQKVAWPWAESAPKPERVPAITLYPRGPGKLLICGVAIAQATSLGGADFDKLMLAMIRLLTDGRAVPTLDAEGIHLARKQSVGSRTRGSDGANAGGITFRERKPGPGTRGKVPPGFSLMETDPAADCNVLGRVAGAGGDVLLNYWNPGNGLRISFAATGIRVSRTRSGRQGTLAAARAALVPGTPFAVKERGDRLMVVAGAAVVEVGMPGLHQGSIAWKGALGDVRYQPVEPAGFSDDFMRTSEESGGWESEGGIWTTAPVVNPKLGANPFSYRVEATGPARSLNGFTYWDDYRFAVSVHPEAGKGSVGLGVYAQNAANLLLFQARVRDAGAKPSDGFSLLRLVNGKPTVIARAPGGLAPGQWYRLQVKTLGPSVAAFVDGVCVLSARDTTFPGGRVALWAEATAARFDDVLVEPSRTPENAGLRLIGSVPRFAGAIDVDSWAGPATPWEADPAAPGLFRRRGAFYGDVGLRFDLPDLPSGAEAALILDGDGASPTSGYSLTLRRGDGGAQAVLRGGDRALGTAAVPAGEVALGLRREGGRVLALANGRALLSAPYAPGAGSGRLAFRVSGLRPRIGAVTAWSANLRDYTFDTAPVDWWVGSGDWDITNRWSCSPEWSWFCGTSEGEAAIWHKRRLEGDVVLDFYAGPKMLGSGENRSERISDFNATLCGDGRSVSSGYALIVAENGAGARLLREGQVVAECKEFRFFPEIHNRWANVRVEKRGGSVRLFIEGQPILRYDDPQPLRGGYAAVWTRHNGIMLPRITLYYEKLGAPLLSLR